MLCLVSLAQQKRYRIPGEPADRAQRNVAHDTRNPELGAVDQCAGERLVTRDVGANEPRQIIDVAGDLPKLGELLDGGEPALGAVLAPVFLQGDLGENGHRPPQQFRRDDSLIAQNDASSFEPAHALKARARRQADGLRQLLDGRTTVALERGEDFDVDPIESRRALGGHKTAGTSNPPHWSPPSVDRY